MADLNAVDGHLAALQPSGESFRQELAEHVAPGALLVGGELVHFGERVGAESDRDVVSRCGFGHDSSVAQRWTTSHDRATVSHVTTYKLTATGHFIGKCVVCAKRYYAASADERNTMFCVCRAGIECNVFSHYHGIQQATLDHPVTAIKWAEVKAAKSDRKCDDRCQSAKGTDCACECDGQNHGAAWGMAVAR